MPSLRIRRLTASAVAVASCLALAGISATGKASRLTEAQLADSFERKLDIVRTNAERERPRNEKVVFEEPEINAYFAQHRLNMPEGVKGVRFELGPEMVVAYTTVDFEELRKSRPNINPLLAIFDGVHDCEVLAYANGSDGRVRVRVESVKIDGLPVPRKAVEMFIKRYVNPKFPEVSLDSEYPLPARIDTAILAEDRGTIVQK